MATDDCRLGYGGCCTVADRMIRIEIDEKTKIGLDNLFVMLGIEGKNFDEQLYDLAARAFIARAEVTKPMISKEGKVERMQLTVKATTEAEMRELYAKLFPYQKFEGWNEFLHFLCNIVVDNMGKLVRYEGGEFVDGGGETNGNSK